MTVPPKDQATLSVTGGNSSHANGTYRPGTAFTLTAAPPKGQRFLCWTLDKALAEGGAILSTDAVYNGTLEGDMTVLGNYSGSAAAPVIYRLAGGSVAATGKDFYLTSFSSPFYLCYNAIGDVGTFVRPGYALLEYNTEPDGSGIAVNPGGKIPIPESGLLELYAVWEKESAASNFTYKIESNGTATVTGYTANESRVIIPSRLGGAEVVTIAAGSFVGKDFETVYIPSTVDTVESGAFVSCSRFDELYLCDTVRYIYNDSFKSCRAFTKFRYNAAMAPVYATGDGSFALKFELVMTEKGNSIVAVAGSSGLYGLDSPLLEELLGGKYQVINYGTNQGATAVLYMEAASHFLEEGDILLSATEHEGRSYGSTAIAWKTFRGVELCYNIFRYVDMSHYTNLFASITEVNTTQGRLKQKAQSYSQYLTTLERHGDTTSNTKHSNFSDTGTITLNASTLSAEAEKGFNLVFKLLSNAGVRVYFTFPPLCDRNLSSSSNCNAYVNALKTKLKNCTVISDDPTAHMLPFSLMCNSRYHPTHAGAEQRTRVLASEILAQLAAEKG